MQKNGLPISLKNRPIFSNYAGHYQLRIRDVDDLERALKLDNTCWMAVSAPCDTFKCDPAFLKYVDSDNNGRIRTDELRSAILWVLPLFEKRDGMNSGSDVLRMDHLNRRNPRGERLHAAALRVLKNLGEQQTTELTLAHVRDLQKIRAASDANGDGVVAPRAVSSPEQAAFIQDIIDTVGSCRDASGDVGVSQAELTRFRKEAEAFLAWKSRGELPEGQTQSDLLPWGNETPQVVACLETVEKKVEEYFSLCRLAALDTRVVDRLRLSEQELAALNLQDPAALDERARKGPLALPDPETVLHFAGRINPCHQEALMKFKVDVVERALGRNVVRLTYAEWQQILQTVKPYREYLRAKPVTVVDKLGVEKLKHYLSGPFDEAIRQLIQKDLAVAGEIAAVSDLEKLILYQQWLLRFANNYISFPHLYDPDTEAMFQMGRLIMSGMDFTFNVKVSSRAEHKQAVQSSSLFVMYVEVTGRETVERFEVATAVTSGDARGLYVGRRGIFIGSDGRVWDARVVDVVVNPVSMWEAMKLPFLRLEQMFERQVERYSGARYATMEAALDREMATLDKGFQALPAAQAPPPSPAPVPAAPASPAATQASAAERARSARDLVLTGSVAVAALGSSFAFVTKTFSDVKWWYLFATLGALLAVIVVPLAVLAFLKLNRRNLTPLLEASGWAINGRIRVNAAMGSLFTRPTIYPRDAWKQRGDSVEVLAEHIEHRGRTLKYSLSILTFLVAFILGSWISPYLVPEFIVRHMKVVWFFLY